MAVAQHNDLHEHQINGGRIRQPQISSFEEKINSTSKRQRRPSVRLVEIGDQPAAALTKQWKTINNRSSKTRPLTNLGGLELENALEETQTERDKQKGDLSFDNLAIRSWKTKVSKPKRESKRPRICWVSKEIHDEGGTHNVGEDGFSRDFEMEEGSKSPLKEQEQNPVLDSLDDDDDDDDDVRELQFRAPHSIRARNGNDVVDLEVPSNNGGYSGRRLEKDDDDGVRVWLRGLGLGRYWPVFQIHEVDEEVLPLLTLEDLKDMGINAVGSRRKMFIAIQKLNNNEGFS